MADLIRPAGGLSTAAKALLVPENIREGVHIKAGGVDVVGAFMGASGAKSLNRGIVIVNDNQTSTATFTIVKDKLYVISVMQEATRNINLTVPESNFDVLYKNRLYAEGGKIYDTSWENVYRGLYILVGRAKVTATVSVYISVGTGWPTRAWDVIEIE